MDLDKLKTIIENMGHSVEFNSETPGIRNADGAITKFEDVPLVYHVFPPINENECNKEKNDFIRR